MLLRSPPPVLRWAPVWFSGLVALSAAGSCRQNPDTSARASAVASQSSASGSSSTAPRSTPPDGPAASGAPSPRRDDAFTESIRSIARSIAALKPRYPQLADFDLERNVSGEQLWISYKYKTTRSTRRGGWTAQVPNPEADGVWFYIDFHDPDSTSQIHTQPFTGRFAFRDRDVSFLILEGEKTKPLRSALWDILRKHGVRALPLSADPTRAP